MSTDRLDKTSLSYWFPRIEAASLPVPMTRIIPMPPGARQCIWASFDGKDGTPEQINAVREFFGKIETAAKTFGFPCFIRTDHTSGKHDWDRTCFLKDPKNIPQHVFNIAEFSEIAGGLPWDIWAVRELLPTIPLGTCPRYGNMPICREFRFFVNDGAVRCTHPYWPREALEQGGADTSIYDDLSRLPIDFSNMHDLAKAAGAAIGGSWSIDVLETRRGWHITDMAEAHKSFHWEGCPHACKISKKSKNN